MSFSTELGSGGAAFHDRTQLFPSHQGPNVLPNDPFFARLLRHASRGRILVRDLELGCTKTYGDALADAVALRSRMEQQLSADAKRRLRQGEEVFFGVLAPGGYEFTVAVLAVLATGAAVVPMTVANPVEEAAFFVSKSKQDLLLSSASATPLARSVVDHLRSHEGLNVPHLEVSSNISPSSAVKPPPIVLSSDRYIDNNKAGVVIFTSGTTGKPKGAVLRRAYICETASAIADGYEITPRDTLLHVLPVHHATGLGTSFFPFLNAGACIEFKGGSFSGEWVWNRLAQGGITVFSAVPTIYMRLMWHYQRNIATLPENERRSFQEGARALNSVVCGSSALQDTVQDFWTKLRGKPILVRYGSSEVPACIRVPAAVDFSTLPSGTVGTAVPGVDAKIDSEGELLIKSPYMFSKYLGDVEATKAAHDKDGFFKTGDICRKDGDYYFIVGRASQDIIKSGGYKIGAIEIERECLSLPYVMEAMVVGVEDEEFGQKVGAAITLEAASSTKSLTLEQLRTDLRQKLPNYKLPTLLRVVPGELPKGGTGKVQKKILGPRYFKPGEWQNDPEVQAWSGRSRTGAKL